VFLPIEIHANKLAPYSELIIFIEYEDNGYHFMCYKQRNTIFCFTHAIFDEELFSKCTNSYAKKCKLYNELFDKISPETELLVPNSSRKDGPALIPILHTLIPPIQNNSSTYSSFSLSYKSIFPSPTPESKKPTVEIEETNDIDFNAKIQPHSP